MIPYSEKPLETLPELYMSRWSISSFSSDKKYVVGVQLSDGKWRCTCRYNTYLNKECKHIRAIKSFLEHEIQEMKGEQNGS